ncbi:MAG: hypothetical protein A4E19_13915 [Nitrospira sp. SG-bin1]|nr:MAG: hypothetical protein A4E19_13915 [Nitrospira sp. SG-bin1]
MTSKGFAQLIGWVFLAIGILGFFPGLKTTPPVGTALNLAVDGGFGYLLGLFPVNWLHNLVHVGVGIAGIASARSIGSAQAFARGLTWLYGTLALMGLFPVLNVTFGLIPIFGHDIWLHAGTAALAAYYGYGRRAEVVETGETYRKAA